MTIDIRVPPADDVRRWADAVETAFGEEMREDRWTDLQRIMEPDRLLGAYDGATIVGGAGAFSYELATPGGVVRAAGVTAVGVLPTHRRRGILRDLMRRQLDDISARGEPVAILWASEGSIYQRFGYGLGTLNGAFDIQRERTAFREPVVAEGSVRLVDRAEAESTLPSIYEQVWRRSPGFVTRSRDYWDVELLTDPESQRHGFSRRYFALYERGGSPEGYAIYRIKPDWDAMGAKSVLRVTEVVATAQGAERELWQFLFSVDLIARITTDHGPVDHPLLLLLAEPRRLGLRIDDGLWLRILDVPGALEARSYRAQDAIVLEVTDAFRPATAGCYAIEASADGARAERTQRPADLAVDIADLGAVYLGAFSFSDLARAGRGRELTAGATARADRLFATGSRPWCPIVF